MSSPFAPTPPLHFPRPPMWESPRDPLQDRSLGSLRPPRVLLAPSASWALPHPIHEPSAASHWCRKQWNKVRREHPSTNPTTPAGVYTCSFVTSQRRAKIHVILLRRNEDGAGDRRPGLGLAGGLLYRINATLLTAAMPASWMSPFHYNKSSTKQGPSRSLSLTLLWLLSAMCQFPCIF